MGVPVGVVELDTSDDFRVEDFSAELSSDELVGDGVLITDVAALESLA